MPPYSGRLRSVTSIAVLGPGGVGGFVAAALARAGDRPAVVARESTAALIAREGIAVRSVRLGEFVAWPEATSELESTVAVLLVTAKATGLEAALGRVHADPSLVVPLLNGLDHMAILRRRFPRNRVAAGVIRIESDRPSPGRVVQTSPSLRVDLASDDPALGPALTRLAERLESAGVPTQIGPSEAQIMWSKLVRLNALACTTSAADREIGFIRSDRQWRPVLERCIDETAVVANADGAVIDPAATLAELDDAHPALGSSMQRDIAAGREPELDAIPGAVLRAGKRHGIECPTIARLTEQIASRAGIPVPDR
jgi:2-dehydropantoate 2-reductase